MTQKHLRDRLRGRLQEIALELQSYYGWNEGILEVFISNKFGDGYCTRTFDVKCQWRLRQ